MSIWFTPQRGSRRRALTSITASLSLAFVAVALVGGFVLAGVRRLLNM